MAARRVSPSTSSTTRGRPATTPEAREQQLIAAAVNLAEKQLSEGTASAQVITHYLKLGSSREQLEQEKIKQEVELARARVESMAAMARTEELMNEALNAFRSYSGQPTEDDSSDYDD